MDIDTNPATTGVSSNTAETDRRADSTHSIRHLALGGLLLAASLGGQAPTAPAAWGPGEPATAMAATAMAVAGPDAISDEVGGLAARLHDADGNPVPGDVFLLMGNSESAVTARLYDATPYSHERDIHDETRASSELAAEVVASVIGSHITPIDMTGAPGGGPSGGITYAIAYLNLVSDGAFTGDLRIASTGRLGPLGHVNQIEHIDVKTVAADLAAVDVFFTPSAPSEQLRDEYGARFVGEAVRGDDTGTGIDDPRRLAEFRRWGATRSTGMDIVDSRHLVDVAAYLCGAGSDFACEVTARLQEIAEQRHTQLDTESQNEADRLLARQG